MKIDKDLEEAIAQALSTAADLGLDDKADNFRKLFLETKDIKRLDELLHIYKINMLGLAAVIKQVIIRHGNKPFYSEEKRSEGEHSIN